LRTGEAIMNSLDDLLTAAGPVPDVSPEGLRNGRATLGAAFSTGLGASAAEAGRKPGIWLSGVRAKALIGTAVTAAGAAAAATVIAMPSSPASPAGSSARPAVTVPKAPAAPTMAPAPATLTAATVLDQAAHAAGSQPGWPNAQYWYTEDQYTCGGRLYTDKDWLSRHGNGVVEKTGPKNGGSACSGGLFTAPIIGSNMFGPYTWSQLYTLPTNPAKLKPKLMADFPSPDQRTLFEDVEFLLVGTPAPPAVLEALFKVEASIPGVKVMGYYTDSLGRTGTAIQLGRDTMVVDPASGVVLDETNSGSTIMFVTQGPATSEPKLAGSGTAPSVRPSSTPAAARPGRQGGAQPTASACGPEFRGRPTQCCSLVCRARLRAHARRSARPALALR